MIKKIVPLLLALIILSSIPLPVCATEEKAVPINLNVKVIKGEEEEYPNIEFISLNGDLYINCSDIAVITRYKYAEGAFDDSAYYSLGDKSVNFFYEGNGVALPNQNFEGMYNGAIQYENKYYLSLSSVLPWLDCDCDIVDGRLTFISEPITFFEVTKQFRSLPSIYLQDYLKEGKKSFTVLAGSNALNNILNGGESIRKAFIAAINGNNPEYFYYDAYMNAFIEMASDDHVGSDAAAGVLNTFKKMRNVNKITKQFGLDLSEVEVSDQAAKFMVEFGLDASLQSDVYDFFDLVKGAYAMAKAAKYVEPLAESMATYEACFNSIKGYNDALKLLKNSTSKNSLMHKASAEALEMIKVPYKSTIKNYIYFAAEETIEKGLEKIISFGTYDAAATVTKMVFSKTYKGISEYGKITVYADICYTNQDIAKGVQLKINVKEQQNGKNAMLLSALATKKTLECISSWEDKLSDPDYVDECISDCNKFIIQLLVSDVGYEERLMSKSENDESLTNWEEIALNYRKLFSEAENNPVVQAPKNIQLKDYIGMTIEEIAAIWGEDYKISSPIAHGLFVMYYEDNRSQCQFEYISTNEMPNQPIHKVTVGKDDDTIIIADELTNKETYDSIKKRYSSITLEENMAFNETFCRLTIDGLFIDYTWAKSNPKSDMADYVGIWCKENNGEYNKTTDGIQSSQTNNAQYEPESNFEYRTNDQIILRYNGSNKHVVIPPTIQENPITKISSPLSGGAFNGNTNIESVVIPDGVISIEVSTFSYCANLKEVILPKTLIKIGPGAFEHCPYLSMITIPNGVTVIDQSAFEGCSSLTTLTIPEGTKTISAWAFRNCTNLKSISLPATINYLGIGIFSGCDNLTDIYYSGTEDEFWNITISGGKMYNQELYSASIHFNS